MKSRFSYILISILMLGVFLAPFSPLIQAQVTPDPVDPRDVCPPPNGPSGTQLEIPEGYEKDASGQCVKKATDPSKANLNNYLRECGTGVLTGGSLIGCFLHISYFIFITIPSWLLVISARMFNYLSAITLSDTMYRADFVQNIWIVVRDFANIFFILILLYAAFQIILGLGHGGGKKIVASVILLALLVNFSLFISKVIIDSSNVLALIFYNKIECVVQGPNNEKLPCPNESTSDSSKTHVTEKNISGALVSKFDINSFYNADFFNSLTDDPKNWRNLNRVGGTDGTLNNPLAFALMVTYGMVIYPLAWIFFITGMSFLGRMIMLMLLMIVSPFAFVTASVHKFRGIDTIGFDSWIKKLLENAFSATVFMAILYLVSEIMNSKIFVNNTVGKLDLTQKILLIFIPALLIVVLLKKGSDYAKKGSAEITGAVLGGAKLLGGLALAGATVGVAGAAWAGRNTVGAFMKGASTGDTAAQRFQRGESLGRWDRLKGRIGYGLGMHRIQQAVGSRVNADQTRVEHYAHARHELDTEAGNRFHGKKFKDLTANERDVVRQRISRDHEGERTFGKKYNQLDAGQKAAVDAVVNPQLAARNSHADNLITDSRGKQGLVSKIVQSSRTGSYDIRNLSKIIPDQYDRNFSKLAQGITGTLAKGIRSGLKGLTNVDHGESQKSFIKDLGSTLSEVMKNSKVKIDVSGVGAEKKEDHGGGGHH